jgi:hypothetical protein
MASLVLPSFSTLQIGSVLANAIAEIQHNLWSKNVLHRFDCKNASINQIDLGIAFLNYNKYKRNEQLPT